MIQLIVYFFNIIEFNFNSTFSVLEFETVFYCLLRGSSVQCLKKKSTFWWSYRIKMNPKLFKAVKTV